VLSRGRAERKPNHQSQGGGRGERMVGKEKREREKKKKKKNVYEVYT
jgi:hypothetical protein